MRSPKITFSDISASLSVSFLTIAAGAALGEWTGIGALAGIVSMAGGSLVSSVFGGMPVKVSGLSATTGALYIGIVETTSLSPEAILWAMLVASVLLYVAGSLRASRFMRYIPNTVISGFINGVGLLLIYKQVQKIIGNDFSFTLTIESYIAIAAIVILFTWREITKMPSMGFIGNMVSGSLIVMAIGALLQFFYQFDIPTLAVSLTSLSSIVMLPTMTALTGNMFGVLLQGVVIAFIVLVSTLITARALDPDSRLNVELRNQSVVNIVSGLLGGYPTSLGFIRTTILKRNNAQTPFIGVLVALWIAIALFFLSDVLSLIPSAVFTGILFVAGYRALDVTMFKKIKNEHNYYFALGIFLLATYLTFIGQLALAVIVGSLLWQACRFIPHITLPDLEKIKHDAHID